MAPWHFGESSSASLFGSLYFASLDCSIGNGQTLGKRFLKVRLVDVNGKPISFEKALARYTIFAAPAISVWTENFRKQERLRVVSALVFVVVFWIGGSTFYLVVLERDKPTGSSRSGDPGSYVVYADHEGPGREQSRYRSCLGPFLALLLLALTLGTAMFKDWSRKTTHLALEFHRDTRLLESLGRSTASASKGKLDPWSQWRRQEDPLYWRREEDQTGERRSFCIRSDEDLSWTQIRIYMATILSMCDSSTGTILGSHVHREHREFEQPPSAWRDH